MRTIIEIPDEQLKPLDLLCKGEGVSRAEFLRRMISNALKNKKNEKKQSLRDHPAFGMFKGTDTFGDGLEYQRKIRAEWADRDHVIDERLGRVKPKKKKR